MDKRGPWTVLKKERAYQTPWIAVDHHDVLDPSGAPSVYGTVHFKNLAVGIVPLDAELNTWIVGQYRFPLDTYSWEIPEGGSPRDVPPIEGAKRELREEVGLEAARWTEILHMHLSNSASDEEALLFVAQDLTEFPPRPDHDEELVQRKLPFSELYDMVLRGEVTDSLTVAAVMKVQLMLLDGSLQK